VIDGELVTIAGRRALRFERRLPHAIERVWRAVSVPDELERWFVATVPWGPREGETFSAYGVEGRITRVDAPRALEWSFGEERYAFALAPDGPEATVLVFTHVFAPAAGPPEQHAAGWRAYLRRLDVHLDGRFLSEQDAHEPWLTAEDGGRTLRLLRRYAHPAERLWRALTDPAEQAAWFPSGEPMEVVEAEPPVRLVARWGGDTLRFALRPDGDGCVLEFTHAVGPPEDAALTAAGWERCFARVDALLAGTPLGEAESLEAWPAVHERYAAELGADPERGRAAYAAHRELIGGGG
jgi:uncharacterized protein YndB with AHSA1/START domain